MLKRVKFLIVDFTWNWRVYFEGEGRPFTSSLIIGLKHARQLKVTS